MNPIWLNIRENNKTQTNSIRMDRHGKCQIFLQIVNSIYMVGYHLSYMRERFQK